MALTGNLVPTPTVDKNGRLTTVHKKPVAVSGAKDLPVKTSAELTARRRKLIMTLAADMESSWESHGGGRAELMRILKSYPDGLLERLKATRSANPSGFALVLIAITRKSASPETVNEFLYFVGDLDTSSYYDARDHMTSLHQYTQLPESDDFSNEEEYVRSQCRALLVVQQACINVDYSFRFEAGAFVIDNDDLVELILANPEKANRIGDFVRERGSIDVELVSEAISSEATALGNGAL